MKKQNFSEYKKQIYALNLETEFSQITLNSASNYLSEIQKTITSLDLNLIYLEVFPITEESIGIEFEYTKNQFNFKLFLEILETTFKLYYILNDSLFSINISNITEIQRLL